jgi:hypothetical protein
MGFGEDVVGVGRCCRDPRGCSYDHVRVSALGPVHVVRSLERLSPYVCYFSRVTDQVCVGVNGYHGGRILGGLPPSARSRFLHSPHLLLRRTVVPLLRRQFGLHGGRFPFRKQLFDFVFVMEDDIQIGRFLAKIRYAESLPGCYFFVNVHETFPF